MATKSLDSEQARRAQEILKRLLAQSYGGNQSAMADALKVKQPTLWAVLNGRKGAGGRILSALYAAHPAAHTELMGGPVAKGAPLSPDHLVPPIAKSSPIPDTKDLARRAVDMLVELDGIPRGVASEKVLDVRLNTEEAPTVEGYYRAARLKDFPRTTEIELKPPPDPPKKRGRK